MFFFTICFHCHLVPLCSTYQWVIHSPKVQSVAYTTALVDHQSLHLICISPPPLDLLALNLDIFGMFFQISADDKYKPSGSSVPIPSPITELLQVSPSQWRRQTCPNLPKSPQFLAFHNSEKGSEQKDSGVLSSHPSQFEELVKSQNELQLMCFASHLTRT